MTRPEFISRFMAVVTELNYLDTENVEFFTDLQVVYNKLVILMQDGRLLKYAEDVEKVRQQFVRLVDIKKDLESSQSDFTLWTQERFQIYKMTELMEGLSDGYLGLLDKAVKNGIDI